MWRSIAILTTVFGLSAVSAQGPQVNALMREKLQHTQKILEAVVTSDWTMLETQTRELEALTRDQRWSVLRYPEYAKYSGQFLQAVQTLHTAAAQRDLEKTPKAYADVTLQCVNCHRYLARARIVAK